jgi:hypothetical protein
MNQPTNPVSSLTKQQRIETELLHSLLDNGETLPWNPHDPDAAATLDRLADAFAEGDLTEDIFSSQWQQVSQLAAQLWTPTPSLASQLAAKFGARMPSQLLNQLLTSAQTVSNQGLAMVDQLVESAQSVLEGWAVEDLQVMARPLAMAMRGGQEEILEVKLRSVRDIAWDDLSDLEKARLSLAISRYILGELNEP